MASSESVVTVRAAEDNRPFFIHDTDAVWRVTSGKFDLFLVRSVGQEPVGPRHHVLRVQEGQAFFALPRPEDSDLGLLACAAPGTEWVRTSQHEIRAAVMAGDETGAISLVEQWITDLSGALTSRVPPKTFEPLEPGKDTQLPKEGKACLPRNGVAWVRHEVGCSRYLGNTHIAPLNGTGFFPVASTAWLEADPFTLLRVASTAAVLEQDPQWLSLHRFHQVAWECLVFNLQQGEQKERERLQLKSQAEAMWLDASFSQLASPLREDKEALPVSTEAGTDPLLMACQAVGASAGIQFRPHPDSRRGIPQKDPINNIAKASGVRVRRVILEGAWWKTDAGPLLAFREADKRPLALLPLPGGGYHVYDPADRIRVRANAKIAKTLEPFAHVFYRPFPATKLAVKDLMAFGLRGCKGDLVMILLMGIAAGLLGMIIPILTGMLFDTIIPGAQREQLLQLSIFLLGNAVATSLFQLTRGFSVLRLEGRMDAAVQSAVWDRLLSLPVPFFRDYSAGDLATRGLGINQMRQALTGSTLSSILSGVFSIFSFVLLFYYSWRLALLAAALILVAFLASTWSGYLQVRHQRTMSEVRGRISGAVLQFITGIAKFRVSGTEGRAFASWAEDFSRQKTLSLRARKVSNHLQVFNAAFPVVSSMAIFYMAAWLMKQPLVKPLTTGEFLAFNAAFGQFLTAVLQLSASIVSVLSIVPLYERAKPILQTLPEVDLAKSDPGELSGNIEVSHLAFRYRPDTPLVLKDVSMNIPAGEFVAFVGSSGCGKSTLFRLLLGFEQPESGAVYYDGQELQQLDVQAVRRQMGVVLQNGKLLSGDIFTNLVGSAPLTVDDAWEAARMAGFDQDIRQMPMGMHTVVSEGGGGLSGGQRQRLMIARAIVAKPRILLFDEATSALDNQTQAIVSKSLEELKATRIVIAHRLSTIIHADRIFVLDKGLVVQSGTYDTLIQQEGLFAELAKRQLA